MHAGKIFYWVDTLVVNIYILGFSDYTIDLGKQNYFIDLPELQILLECEYVTAS